MSPATPNVYVLMAVYNGEPWLPEQIQSVLNQEDVAVRLFISVDLSKDDSLAYCQRLSEENPEVEGARLRGAIWECHEKLLETHRRGRYS
jgi:rhamnosyltransferase